MTKLTRGPEALTRRLHEPLRSQKPYSGPRAELAQKRSAIHEHLTCESLYEGSHGVAVMELMFAALLRASESWRSTRIAEFELRQLNFATPN